jgi:hypothetical protein
MNLDIHHTLAQLIRGQQIAALGTLRDGSPYVSMVLYAPAADFSAFYILISRLAHHTQDILKDPRVSLMIAECERGERDPQRLGRISITGRAGEIPTQAGDYQAIKDLYLARFPQASANFFLRDFSIFQVQPEDARYVAGFGQIFNPTLEDFKQAAAIDV